MTDDKLKEHARQIIKDLEFIDETQESYNVLNFVSNEVMNDTRIPKDKKLIVSARIVQMYVHDENTEGNTLADFITRYEGYLAKATEFYGIEEKYRTKAKAGYLDEIPTSLAFPTMAKYQYSIGLHNEGDAYIQPLTSTDGLSFDDGKMFFANNRIKQISEVELQNMKTKEGIDTINLPLLRTFYSIIFNAFQKTNYQQLKPVITLYVPELAKYLGIRPKGLNKEDINNIIIKTQAFHNIVGIQHGTRNGKPVQSIYPVLNFEGYNEDKNTISISSPYFNNLIMTLYNLAVKKDKDGKPKIKRNGSPAFAMPINSYLVNADIAKERNKVAVENVFIIAALIEQAGNNIPRIKASTIVERNVQLQERLQTNAKPNRLLSTTFKKTWELLRTKTTLGQSYYNIQLPDPKDPANIPTMKTLETTVFKFQHDGKAKAEKKAKITQK